MSDTPLRRHLSRLTHVSRESAAKACHLHPSIGYIDAGMGDPQTESSGLRLLRGLLRHYPFVLKNFKHYFQNLYRREILHTDIVAPYAAVFYTTHKCNLECTYCTQKEPDVFSQELPTDTDH